MLLWLVLGIAAWWMLRAKPRAGAPGAARGPAPTRGRALAAPEAMVDCAACGLHFPASEAVRDGARTYCCAAHRAAGPRRAG